MISPSGIAPPVVLVVGGAFTGGAVPSLHEDSSEDEESSSLLVSVGEPVTPSCFVASRVGPPPLLAPSVFGSDVLRWCMDASAGVGPEFGFFVKSFFFAYSLAPLVAPRGARACPMHWA